MNHETQHEGLAKLGEELLREFDAAQTPVVSVEFDRKCQKMFFPERKKSAWLFARWAVRAAILALALVGAMTVLVLSIGSLRNAFVQLTVAYHTPEREETMAEYRQLSHTATDNAAFAVYYDGEDSYQIRWSNEFGQRVYTFCSQDMDEAFFHDLGAQLAVTEK